MSLMDDPLGFLSGLFGSGTAPPTAVATLGPSAAGGGATTATPSAPAAPSAPQGMFGLGPLSWSQKLGLMLNAASDAANRVARQPTQNFQSSLGLLQLQRQMGVRGQLASALASGDPNAIANAKAMALAAGVDLTPFLPKYQDVRPGGALVGIDPLSGKTTQSFQAQMRTRPGYHWETTPDGETVERYDVGGPADPDVIGADANARAQAIQGARRGAKPQGAASTPATVMPPAPDGPWSNYGDN